MPRVSVILPTYNREHLVGRAINSVLNQTYQNLELIVVDSSTDNTEEVIKGFNDPRIHYIQQENRCGPGAARNIGIKAAKGEYIAFQDSDDEWLPQKLDMQLKAFNNSVKEVGVIYSDMCRIIDGKKIYWFSPSNMPEDEIIYKNALQRVFNIGIQTALVKKSCLIKSGSFDESLPCLEDFDFFIRLSKYYYFYYINIPFVKYYDTIGSISKNAEGHMLAYQSIIKKYHKDMNKKSLAEFQFIIGNMLCEKGMMEQGKYILFCAARSYPLNFKYQAAALVSSLGKDVYANVCMLKRLIHPKNIT